MRTGVAPLWSISAGIFELGLAATKPLPNWSPMQKKAEYLIGKLKISKEKLDEIEIKFEELRVKTNAFYGEEILKKSKIEIMENNNPSDVDKGKWWDLLDDPSDWWKKL